MAEENVKVLVRAHENPSIEQLMEWENEGGCESACAHQSWVEPDGRCPECGAPSWLLHLGFI